MHGKLLKADIQRSGSAADRAADRPLQPVVYARHGHELMG